MPTGDEVKPIIMGVSSTDSLTTAQVATYDPMDGVHAYDLRSEDTQQACTTAGGSWVETDTENHVSHCYDDLTTKIQVTNPVVDTAGSYVVRYLVSDWQGNYAEAFTTVTVTN